MHESLDTRHAWMQSLGPAVHIVAPSILCFCRWHTGSITKPFDLWELMNRHQDKSMSSNAWCPGTDSYAVFFTRKKLLVLVQRHVLPVKFLQKQLEHHILGIPRIPRQLYGNAWQHLNAPIFQNQTKHCKWHKLWTRQDLKKHPHPSNLLALRAQATFKQ